MGLFGLEGSTEQKGKHQEEQIVLNNLNNSFHKPETNPQNNTQSPPAQPWNFFFTCETCKRSLRRGSVARLRLRRQSSQANQTPIFTCKAFSAAHSKGYSRGQALAWIGFKMNERK